MIGIYRKLYAMPLSLCTGIPISSSPLCSHPPFSLSHSHPLYGLIISFAFSISALLLLFFVSLSLPALSLALSHFTLHVNKIDDSTMKTTIERQLQDRLVARECVWCERELESERESEHTKRYRKRPRMKKTLRMRERETNRQTNTQTDTGEREGGRERHDKEPNIKMIIANCLH